MYIVPESILSTLESSTPLDLTVREALSGILGSISIACWVFLLLPQVIENYRNQSAEALSLAFVLIWLIGDVTNLLGGLWTGLVPTAIVLAVWFCVTDAVLVTQCLYYGIRIRQQEGKTWLAAARASISGDMNGAAAEAVARHRRQQLQQQQQQEEDEEQPLLKRTTSASPNNHNNHNSHTDTHTREQRSRTSTTATTTTSPDDNFNTSARRRRSSVASTSHLAQILEDQNNSTSLRKWMLKTLSVFGVFAVGALGWLISYKAGVWQPTPVHGDIPGREGNVDRTPGGAQTLGYISAVAYLGARIPQIIKNWREQSCEGLSLLFFILSLSGNLTYGASLLVHSTEHAYVIKNLPWLIGSMGTMVEDVIIFVQFHVYGDKGAEQSVL